MSAATVNILASTAQSQTRAASSALSLAGLSAGPAGLVASGVVGGIGAIAGIITHHAQAVKTEANNMNAAVPAFVTQMQMIFAQLNSGQFDANTASIYIDQTVQQYYNNISGIMKKGGPCKVDASCTGSKAGIDPCNAACSVGCEYIESIACKAKKLLQVGGTITIDAFGGVNSALQRQNSFTLTYGRGPGGVSGTGTLGQTVMNNQTPLSVSKVGLSLPDGTVIPYSQLSSAALVGASQQPSILSAITPQTSTGKAILIGAIALGGIAILLAIAK